MGCSEMGALAGSELSESNAVSLSTAETTEGHTGCSPESRFCLRLGESISEVVVALELAPLAVRCTWRASAAGDGALDCSPETLSCCACRCWASSSIASCCKLCCCKWGDVSEGHNEAAVPFLVFVGRSTFTLCRAVCHENCCGASLECENAATGCNDAKDGGSMKGCIVGGSIGGCERKGCSHGRPEAVIWPVAAAAVAAPEGNVFLDDFILTTSFATTTLKVRTFPKSNGVPCAKSSSLEQRKRTTDSLASMKRQR
jgi:hypothetical protein